MKKGLASTMVASVVAGAGSVVGDYVIAQIDALSSVDSNYINGGKIVAGAILGSMTRNTYLKSMADGLATVGAAQLVESLISTTTPASGLTSNGTVGRVMAGDRYFKKGGKGFSATAFMGK